MDGNIIGGFIVGFAFGGACGALYATNLYGKKPADLVEAQAKRNNEWGNEIKIALGFNKNDTTEQAQPTTEVVENPQVVQTA